MAGGDFKSLEKRVRNDLDEYYSHPRVKRDIVIYRCKSFDAFQNKEMRIKEKVKKISLIFVNFRILDVG